MEEESKKKKDAIKRKLLERYQRNQQEAQSLAHIKTDLERIDADLANEISILREKIDRSDRDAAYLFRVFKQAEEAYVASKKEYERKAGEKVKLTEHLSIIIQENEKRKAKKLGELLQLLDPEAAAEAEAEREMLQQTSTVNTLSNPPPPVSAPSSSPSLSATASSSASPPTSPPAQAPAQVSPSDGRAGDAIQKKSEPDPGRPSVRSSYGTASLPQSTPQPQPKPQVEPQAPPQQQQQRGWFGFD